MPTDELSQAAWVGIVQQLCDHLQENEDKIQFLRRIDKSMVNPSINLEEFIANNMSDLVRFSRATRGHFYVDSGDELFLLHTTSLPGIAKSVLSYNELSSVLPVDQRTLKVVEKNDFDQLKQTFSHSSGLLLVPIRRSEDQIHTLTGDRFGVIILETQHPEAVSHFRNQAIQSFVHTVAGQLALGLQFRLRDRQTKWFQALMNSFFRLDLGPYKCFKELVKKIPDYLPTFGPFRIEGDLSVDIAIYRPDGNYLTILSSTVGDVGTKLKVEESVIGLLFENPDRPYILGDPFNDSTLKPYYKAYQEETKTELVVPVKESTGKRVAAVNLESRLENAFTKIHVDAVIELCDILAPMITALHSRLIERDTQQQAVLNAQQSYWNTIGALLRHNTNSQLASIRMGIDNAKMAAELNKIEKIEESLTPVHNNLNMVAEEIEQFSKEIYSYTVYGNYSIHHLISEAISKIKARADKEKKILIDFVPDQDFQVFCSPILMMHLYNILDNSIYWVEQRLLQEPNHQAKISIRVGPGPLPDKDQERELNQTCEVIIEDNGLGCPKDILDKLLHRPVTSRRTGEQGMGHALYAVANYAYGIDGSIKIESEEGQWFKTTIQLPIFDDRIHQARSSI